MSVRFQYDVAIVAAFAAGLVSCNHTRLAECHLVLDEVATQSQHAMVVSGDPEQLKQALGSAATSLGHLRVQNAELRKPVEDYVDALTRASTLPNTAQDHAATGALGYATAEVISAINLRCSAER